MTSFLEMDAAERHEERTAARHSGVLFSQRADAQFGAFLRSSSNKDDFEGRLSLVEADLERLAADVMAETGDESGQDYADHYRRHLAGGAFCDDCRKWKNGPKQLCSCEDEPGLLDDAPSAVGEKSSKTFTCPGCKASGTYQAEKGNPHRGVASGNSCNTCKTPIQEFVYEDDEDKGKTSSDSTGLSNKPSGPAIDKSKAGDEQSNKKREPIDTDGGPYKTRKQDVAEPADYTKKDFLDQTDEVGKHDEDVTKGSENSGEKPKKHVPFGKGKQADPVTSHFMSADVADSAIADYLKTL